MKNKLVVFVLAIFLLISTLFVSVTVENTSNQEQIRKTMVANIFQSSYTGIIDFEHIAYTLTARTGVVNDFCYSGILRDGTISENEVKYLTILKSDIDIIIQSMVSEENPLKESQNLRPSQIDNILNTFFSVW